MQHMVSNETSHSEAFNRCVNFPQETVCFIFVAATNYKRTLWCAQALNVLIADAVDFDSASFSDLKLEYEFDISTSTITHTQIKRADK